ncbi:sigma-70 family RNA polymerase sigma factor [Flavobacterium sp.]|uniref:RNA polymerase sigma factor n=1 Tax=Flavobacterium sp. TaxID=239 RepID=UPI00261C4282|nr:sigma-70 family RNA polymerase sigma factor [Flavobacterium sp.]
MATFNWNEIYSKTSPKLLGICRRYIKDLATAEDIIQDSFIVAIQKENTLKDANAINGWLSRIVINMAIHHLKETKKINFSTDQDCEIADATTLMNTAEIDSKSILLSSDLEKNDILEAIDQLPEHHKSVFNLYVIDQFSHVEIGKILNISTGTSKSHLFRARKAIQTFLLEKIQEKPVDQKKKRRVAFLLFLGFGNQMFANYYRKPFRDFEIQPQKKLELNSGKLPLPKDFIGLSQTSFAVKTIAASLVLISILSIFVYAYTYRNNTNPVQKTPEVKPKSITNSSTNQPLVNTVDSVKNQTITIPNPNKTETVITSEKATVLQNNTTKTTASSVVTTLKDSIPQEPQKVVVIKKQIVKKDTIYVTR